MTTTSFVYLADSDFSVVKVIRVLTLQCIGDPRAALHACDWYVVAGMYTCGTSYWKASLPWCWSGLFTAPTPLDSTPFFSILHLFVFDLVVFNVRRVINEGGIFIGRVVSNAYKMIYTFLIFDCLLPSHVHFCVLFLCIVWPGVFYGLYSGLSTCWSH